MRYRDVVDVYRGYRVPRFQLVEHKNRWFIFSGVLIVLSIIGLVFVRMTFSIDFEGGTRISYPLKTDVGVEEIRSTVEGAGFTVDEVQIVFDEQGRSAQIRMGSVASPTTASSPSASASGGSPSPSVSSPTPSGSPSTAPSATPSVTQAGASGDVEALRKELATQAGIDAVDVNVENIGPTWGTRISRQALVSLLIALGAIAAYIALRFEWTMSVGALIALVHDLVITAGLYALVGREVTPETVIAILTILGFSLYDTVVIYDKIKELTESPAMVARLGYDGVVDLGLNQTIMRSVNTSLVVLLPILSLLLFGGETLKDFAFAMFVGVAIGAYSSIFIAAPILTILHRRQVAKTPAGRPRPTGARTAVPATAAAASAAAATAGTAKVRTGPSRPAPKSKRRPPAKRKRR